MRHWIATTIAVLAITGCSESPEKAAARAAKEGADQAFIAREMQKIEDSKPENLAKHFAGRVRSEWIPALDALSADDVSDMEGTASAYRTLNAAAMALRQVSDAKLGPDGEAARRDLASRLRARQVALYPLMRKAHAQNLNGELGGNGITVSVGGARNKTLRVNSIVYLSKDETWRAHDNLASQATRLRFTRAEYSSGGGGGYAFTVHGDADDAID